jgi:hypothetical protein
VPQFKALSGHLTRSSTVHQNGVVMTTEILIWPFRIPVIHDVQCVWRSRAVSYEGRECADKYGENACWKMSSLKTEEDVGIGRNWLSTVFCGGLLYSGLKNRVNSNW